MASLTVANEARWQKAKVKPSLASKFGAVAKRLAAKSAKTRYQAMQARTGVPWFVIAVIHERESSQRWDRSIAQGDPWNKKSTHVPKGRGPFASWEDAAYDALMKCAPYAGKWTDWSAGGAMTLLEHYNGLGYANKGRPSPYIWAGTDQYVIGKYVSDGKYDPNVVDSQLGCAGLILAMAKIDSSVGFGGGLAALVSSLNGSDPASDSQAVAPAGDVAASDPPDEGDAVEGDPELFSVQRRLKARKYSPGIIDGLWGSGTSGALGGFINDRGGHIPVPASLDAFNAVREDIKAELGRAESENWFRPVSAARASGDAATVATVAPEVVPVRRSFFATAWASVAAFFAAAWDTISGYVSQAWDFFTDHKDDVPTDSGILSTAWGYVTSVPTPVWLALAGAGLAFVALDAWKGVKKITTSVQTGERQ